MIQIQDRVTMRAPFTSDLTDDLKGHPRREAGAFQCPAQGPQAQRHTEWADSGRREGGRKGQALSELQVMAPMGSPCLAPVHTRRAPGTKLRTEPFPTRLLRYQPSYTRNRWRN